MSAPTPLLLAVLYPSASTVPGIVNTELGENQAAARRVRGQLDPSITLACTKQVPHSGCRIVTLRTHRHRCLPAAAEGARRGGLGAAETASQSAPLLPAGTRRLRPTLGREARCDSARACGT